MSFLLDTDICSAHLRGNRDVYGKLLQHGGNLYISSITLAELETWVRRKKSSPQRREGLQRFLADVTIVDFDHSTAEVYGELRAAQLDESNLTPQLDLQIGATALARNFTLVTHNTADYERIPGLRIVDWLA